MRRALVSVVVAALLAPVPASAARGARIVGDKKLSPRLHELLVRSPAVGRDVKVRLLLPTRFNEDSTFWLLAPPLSRLTPLNCEAAASESI